MPVESFPLLSAEELRKRSMSNLLRMGHCAPTVMQTMLDASETEATWLVLLMAGLPGGIGNTGAECGGLTAPLVLMGLRHRREQTVDGLPVVVDKGHDLLQRFTARCGTTQCREILGDARVPLRCVGVVSRAPAMCAQCIAASGQNAIAPESREAYREVYAHWQQRRFHCADAVFAGLDTTGAPDDLADAVTAFLGGTVFTGMTCSALTAGVMALGLALGEIEDSRRRVVRMIATMALGGDAIADDVNKFNRVVNLGHDLAGWFQEQFGSTQCRALTGCDFASAEGVHAYIEHDGTSQCARMARLVAERITDMIAEAAADRSAADGTASALAGR
jgi:Putative redox-active protein (C_GCAxxG_C_C)